ncbi:MAG: hypothetical protein AAFY02_19870, partial [Pseudomonadota bacterium]
DRLFGGADGDWMQGDSGADTLAMGKDDQAFGGSGADWFLFLNATLGSGDQVIRDFNGVSLGSGAGDDKIVFATGLETGSFSYIGDAGFSADGNSEARFAGAGALQIDQDGDGSSDISVFVDGVSLANQLTASDFLWL